MRALFALMLLATVPANAAEKYNRDDWPRWIDADRDCQNTRHEILIKPAERQLHSKRTGMLG